MDSVPWEVPPSEKTRQGIFEACNLNNIEHKDNCRILDFGCGNGRYLEMFAQLLPVSNLHGVETDPDRVSEVIKKGFQCILIDEDQAVLPYDSSFFDVIFSSNVIEHIPRPIYLKYIEQIHDRLKPGGRFVVGTPNYPIKRIYDMKKAMKTKHKKYYLFDDPTHVNKLTFSQLEMDLRKHFSIIELEPTYIFFQKKLKFLQKPVVRYKLRFLGDKIFGYCQK